MTASRADVRVKAYSGEPMGVGKVTIDLPPDGSAAPLSDDRFTISNAAGRILYPAPERKRVRKILRNLLGIETPRRITYFFLFLGDEPLVIDIYAPERFQVTVIPKRDQEDHAELFD
ncbi:MAG: hypothetical protein ACR2NU_13825, partial [Aeoliella sp.]